MVIFITGISSGFGLETARLLSQEGHAVYGTVRREVTSLPQVNYIRLDVRDTKAVQQAVQQIIETEGRIDVLINNAGTGIGGPLEFATEEEIREQMDANFMGLVPYPAYQKAIDKVEHDESGGLKPHVLARRISRIIRKKNPRYGYVVASFEQRLSVFLKRALPAKWFASILGKYYKL